jgi:hypothetical protein
MPMPTVAMNMWRPALIKLTVGGVDSYLSDHNRSPVQVSNTKIENSKRMANGLMRKYVVANKKSFSVSWSNIPSLTSQTVDGYLGAMPLQDFYNSNFDNTITLSFYSGTSLVPTQAKGTSPSATSSHTVFISSFSCTINKRLGDIDYWDVSIDLEEA